MRSPSQKFKCSIDLKELAAAFRGTLPREEDNVNRWTKERKVKGDFEFFQTSHEFAVSVTVPRICIVDEYSISPTSLPTSADRCREISICNKTRQTFDTDGDVGWTFEPIIWRLVVDFAGQESAFRPLLPSTRR